jgi:hypothetical protein
MPRFGTKTLLIATAVVALWLSTLSGYAAGNDVRRSILLLILVASAFAAIYGREKTRAFWSGFFVVMLLCGGTDLQRPLHRYLPDFSWLSPAPVPTMAYQVASRPGGQLRVVAPSTTPPGYSWTSFAAPAPTAPPIWTIVVSNVWIIVLSLVGGFIAALIFAMSRGPASQASGVD